MRANSLSTLQGTPPDLIAAADTGARIATRAYRFRGLDDVTIRRKVIAEYAKILDWDSRDEYGRETLMAAVQRAIDDILPEPGARPITEELPWDERRCGPRDRRAD